MPNENTQPTIDFLQIFCINFESHFDLSGEIGHRNNTVRWTEQFDLPKESKRLAEINQEQLDKVWKLKKARQVFEVFQVILDKTKDHNRLALEVLEFYAPTPIEKFCPLSEIAEALVKVGLVDSTIDVIELENNLAGNYKKWLDLAVKRSKEILLTEFPDIEKFEGETAWVKMNGVDRWGPVHTVNGNFFPLLSSLKID